MQNSNSFFTASKSMSSITETLNATCEVVFPTCNSLMASLAQQIRLDSNCGDDYTRQNPIVLQAYNGFLAYSTLYQAGCLKDGDGSYCFANAITNTSSPTDSYVYYLPVGIELPGGARPTCSNCLKSTMTIFKEAASNPSQPISSDYTDAAEQIDFGCGPDFVNSTVVKTAASSEASPASVSWRVGLIVPIAASLATQLL